MNARRWSFWSVGAVALLLCAQAQASVGASGSDGASRVGAEAGMGISNFTGDLGDCTNAGVGWNARGVYNFSPNIGVEVSYLGAHNTFDDQRLTTHEGITTTSLSGDLKLAAPFRANSSMVIEPFVAGGFGGAFYTVTENNSPLYASGGGAQVPMGVGANFLIDRVATFGLRGDYLANLSNTLVTTESVHGNQWAAQANLGFHY